MKLKLLANSIEDNVVTKKQHYTCFLLNDNVAIDAGNLASATSPTQKLQIKNIVLTHAHLDHIAGLPLFIDDLFNQLEQPIQIHSTEEVARILERDIFNWSVYPKFSELENGHGPVMSYRTIIEGRPFVVEGLELEAVGVNHKVPAVGFLISDEGSKIAISGDTAEMSGFWERVNVLDRLDALLIECAFPNRLLELAAVSHHLTPNGLAGELEKLAFPDCRMLVINMKPMYCEEIADEILALGIRNLEILEVGTEYNF